MSDSATIDPKTDGPLQVSGAVALLDSRGENIATDARYWLCRCGGSTNKPFCDGTHKKLGFSSARQSDPAKRGTKHYAGQHLTIHDNRSACAHAAHCVGQAPEVFRMTARPWIDADAEATEKAIAAIKACPSGALAYSIDGVLQQPAPRAAAIHITKDGPYAVVGAPQLNGDDTPVSNEHYTLCRCGQSKNKPFCDGAHASAGFKDEKN